MLVSDLRNAMELQSREGWNQTEKDWMLLLGNKSNRCVVAEDGGKVIGTATAINYDEKEAWIGMVLVNSEYRRQGIGRLLMVSIMDTLQGFRSIKLDATPAGQPVYEKLGFKGEYILHRMACDSFNGITAKTCPEIKPMTPGDLPEIMQFDFEIFGADRTYLLSTIRSNYPHKAFVLRRNNRVEGYVLGRDGMRFNYIGPVYAHSSEDAGKLLAAALQTIDKGAAVAVDIMEDRDSFKGMLEEAGFSVQRQFLRMYLDKNPFPGLPEKQYLISGPEFG
jgi:GNAT superfamily N-acetyltransferase